MTKLTKKLVDEFRCPEGKQQAFLWCSERRGFALRVTAAGVKSFIVQGRVGLKERRETIGRYGVYTVNQARKQAEDLLRDMRNGVDPRAEKKRQAALRVTLQEVADHYVENKRTKNGQLRASSKADINRHVTQNFTTWAREPVGSITRDKCLKHFNELTKRSPSQANQAFIILRALLNHAREMHATDDGDYPLLPINPVQRMLKLQKLNPEAPRDRRIPTEKIGAVWSMLQERIANARTFNDQSAAAYVAFLLLTGARKTEAATLTWDRINFDEGFFYVPKDIAKNHNPLVFPLSATLRELLNARPRVEGNEHVFASWGKKSGHIGDPRGVMDRVSGIAGTHLSLHDLRRTADDVAKVCKVDADERRQLLNHLSSDVHGRHYANNPDPVALLPAVESMHAWIVAQGRIAQAMASGANITLLRA
jgi:integrase